jgi:hypothetical protein
MKNQYNEMDLACYALGYYEARAKGRQLTMCETAQDNHAYQLGFEAGIQDNHAYQLGFEAGMTDSARYEGDKNAN